MLWWSACNAFCSLDTWLALVGCAPVARRVQQLAKPKMRASKQQGQLSRLWSQVMVLVIEEVSMVAAALYNAVYIPLEIAMPAARWFDGAAPVADFGFRVLHDPRPCDRSRHGGFHNAENQWRFVARALRAALLPPFTLVADRHSALRRP